MKRCRRLVPAVIVLAAASVSFAAATAEPRPVPEKLAWLGLFNGELIHWLENANRLGELCPDQHQDAQWYECRAAFMAPKLAVVPIWAEPRRKLTRLGELVLLAEPGHGMRVFVSTGGRVQPFTPDLHLADWGYGPYFHQTILMQDGSWFRIPLPVVGTAWIDANDWATQERSGGQEAVSPHVEVLGEGAIIVTPRGEMVVLGVEKHVLRVRPEQPADQWCEAGDPPPIVPWAEQRLSFEELFDADGHMLISYKYMKGC